mgnify:CR=1 FL=1
MEPLTILIIVVILNTISTPVINGYGKFKMYRSKVKAIRKIKRFENEFNKTYLDYCISVDGNYKMIKGDDLKRLLCIFRQDTELKNQYKTLKEEKLKELDEELSSIMKIVHV